MSKLTAPALLAKYFILCSYQVAAADVAEADIQAKAELLPDFWAEPPSVSHTPPVRDMHEEVALQQVPLHASASAGADGHAKAQPEKVRDSA